MSLMADRPGLDDLFGAELRRRLAEEVHNLQQAERDDDELLALISAARIDDLRGMAQRNDVVPLDA